MQGILAYTLTQGNAASHYEWLNVGIVVFRRGRAVLANQAASEWFGDDIAGTAWDDVSGLPDWESVIHFEGQSWLVDLDASRKIALHRQDAESVMVECLPSPRLMEGAISLTTAAEMVYFV